MASPKNRPNHGLFHLYLISYSLSRIHANIIVRFLFPMH